MKAFLIQTTKGIIQTLFSLGNDFQALKEVDRKYLTQTVDRFLNSDKCGGMALHAFNLSTQVAEAANRSQTGLHSEFQTSQGYLARLHLKNKTS